MAALDGTMLNSNFFSPAVATPSGSATASMAAMAQRVARADAKEPSDKRVFIISSLCCWCCAVRAFDSADIVTANGRLVVASPTEHADLYWAGRGGGANLGGVTSFEYRLLSGTVAKLVGHMSSLVYSARPRFWFATADPEPIGISSGTIPGRSASQGPGVLRMAAGLGAIARSGAQTRALPPHQARSTIRWSRRRSRPSRQSRGGCWICALSWARSKEQPALRGD